MQTVYKVSAEASNRYSLFLTLAEAQTSASARTAKTGNQFTVEAIPVTANVR